MSNLSIAVFVSDHASLLGAETSHTKYAIVLFLSLLNVHIEFTPPKDPGSPFDALAVGVSVASLYPIDTK